MRRIFLACTVTASLFCLISSVPVEGQAAQPLRLIQTISMPNVEGRLDHMDVDVDHKRLFVAGLENSTVEVIDLQQAKWARSISGFKKPQGISFVPSLNKVFVASGDDGMLRVYRGDMLELLDSIKLDLGPNRVLYDPQSKLLYVGYGGAEAGKDYGEIAIVDATVDKLIGTVRVAGHPAELLLDNSTGRLFVFVSIKNEIQVIDKKTRTIVATWPVSAERPGDAAFDTVSQRLLMGTRTPPKMIVIDSNKGNEVADLPTAEGMDGVYYDTTHKRIYVSGGRGLNVGAVFVYQQRDRDHYNLLGTIPTKPGAGTSFWSPELDRYYVAVPAHGADPAAILVFEPQ